MRQVNVLLRRINRLAHCAAMIRETQAGWNHHLCKNVNLSITHDKNWRNL
jgi:nuclear transport factor 2 (NTF2) superfamily protein